MTMAAIKNVAMRIPSGRSIMLTAVVYTNTPIMTQKAVTSFREPAFRTSSVTATDAELIRTRTPVAYAVARLQQFGAIVHAVVTSSMVNQKGYRTRTADKMLKYEAT